MRKAAYLICAIALLCGCSNHLSKEEVKEYGEAAYADLVSFIAAGFQRQWNEMSPEEMDLSPEYRHCSPYAGFARTDIDGDGFPELLIGEQFEDGSYCLYDIFCINKKDASLIHLAGGGESDCFTIGPEGQILEIPVTPDAPTVTPDQSTVTPDPITVTPDPIRGPSNERDSGTKSGMTKRVTPDQSTVTPGSTTVTPDQSTVTPDLIRGPSNERDSGTKSGMTKRVTPGSTTVTPDAPTVTPDAPTVTPDLIRGPSNEGNTESMELRLQKFKDYQ